MLDKVLSTVAPHYCCGCDKIGSLLCDNCKYNISAEASPFCIVCHRPTSRMWLCSDCKMPYERAWAVGERADVLQRLIGLYKFERAKAAYVPLGDLLLSALPDLPLETVVVPVPTVWAHVRERGYDHTLLIAKYIAKARNLSCCQLVERQNIDKQRQATARQRLDQARRAFLVTRSINSDIPYLLIDDVMTTGSTIKYAAKALREAGAKHVWVAIIARQTLD